MKCTPYQTNTPHIIPNHTQKILKNVFVPTKATYDIRSQHPRDKKKTAQKQRSSQF